MASEDTRERIARAIFGSVYTDGPRSWAATTEKMREEYRRFADAALAVVSPSPVDADAERLLQNAYDTLSQVYWAARNGQIHIRDMQDVLDRHRPLLGALTDRVVSRARRPELGDRGVLERIREQAALEADDTPSGLVFSSIANEAEAALGRGRSLADVRAAAPPVGVDEGHRYDVVEIEKQELAGPFYTRYQAVCKTCTWEGPVRGSHLGATTDADEHLARSFPLRSAAPGVTSIGLALTFLRSFASADPETAGRWFVEEAAEALRRIKAPEAALAVSPSLSCQEWVLDPSPPCESCGAAIRVTGQVPETTVRVSAPTTEGRVFRIGVNSQSGDLSVTQTEGPPFALSFTDDDRPIVPESVIVVECLSSAPLDSTAFTTAFEFVEDETGDGELIILGRERGDEGAWTAGASIPDTMRRLADKIEYDAGLVSPVPTEGPDDAS